MFKQVELKDIPSYAELPRNLVDAKQICNPLILLKRKQDQVQEIKKHNSKLVMAGYSAVLSHCHHILDTLSESLL